MPHRQVHFATNRIWDRGAAAFGAVCEAPASRLWLGSIAVERAVDLNTEGAVGPPDVAGFDDFLGPVGADGSATAVLAAWLAGARARDAVPLLMVHGFDNTFVEACSRAGRFCDAIEATTDLRLQPLAFTWPSNGITSLSAYENDQQDCAASGPALARLIRAIGALGLGDGRKPAYLAHSMGARATRCGMQAMAAEALPPPPRVFGAAIVIAGDEDADVLAPPGGPLRPLLEIADWTTIGVYAQDATLSFLSGVVRGQGARLGAGGPRPPLDPADRVFTVDYGYAVSHKEDMVGVTTWNDVAHQYYRNDPRVLRDLGEALRGAPADAVPGRRWGAPDPNVAFSEKAGRLYVV